MTQEAIYRTFRLAGIFGIAVVAVVFPGVGEHRFWLAGILVCVCLPTAYLLEIHYPAEETAWTWPFFDLTLIVVLTNLVPESWNIGLLIGAVVVGSAGIIARRIGLWMYALLPTILIAGMTIPAIVHEVEGWVLPIAALCAIFPTVMFYANWEGLRSNLLYHRAESLRGLTLVAGGVAHDFNNMLTVISGNTELALEKQRQNSPVTEELQLIVEASTRAKALTQQLLAFSGSNLEVMETIDLEAELMAMRRLLEKALPTGSTLEINSSAAPSLVACHHAQLQQVLMNIIINAGEASKPGPPAISVTLSREVTPPDSKSWVVLEVRDQGVGISADLLPRIFEPFVSSKPTGYGLGLASAKRILSAHGGDITVASEEGIGTTVRLRLPAQENHQPVFNVREPRQQAAKSGLILVVDDDAGIRSVVCRQLESIGFETVTAADGEQGLRRFQEHPETEAVVLDLKMPVMDGWQCLSAIREVEPEIPVVIISGYNPGDALDLAVNSNVTVLGKPFRIEALADALGAVVSSRQRNQGPTLSV